MGTNSKKQSPKNSSLRKVPHCEKIRVKELDCVMYIHSLHYLIPKTSLTEPLPCPCASSHNPISLFNPYHTPLLHLPTPQTLPPLHLTSKFNLTSSGGTNVTGLPPLLSLIILSTRPRSAPSPNLTLYLRISPAKNATNSTCAKRRPRHARGPSENVMNVPLVWFGIGVVLLVVSLLGFSTVVGS